jgi:hypothetical protein
MRAVIPFLLACACAASAPWLTRANGSTVATAAPAAAWPAVWGGRNLRPLPLLPQETAFAAAFPGSIARFTDGESEILFRRVEHATRKLHPASDCLRASGYAIHPLPAVAEARGRTWSCFLAKRADETLEVREMVAAGSGEIGNGPTWTDVSSWYWYAFWGDSAGPWTAITVSRRLF